MAGVASPDRNPSSLQDEAIRLRVMVDGRQRELLEWIIHEAPRAIALLEGPEHRHTIANPAYYAVVRGKGEIVGQTVAQVWPEAANLLVPLLDGVFQTGKPFQAVDMAVPMVHDRGLETAYFTFTYAPIRDPEDQVEGILFLAIETTEQVRGRQEIESERARLKELAYSLGVRVEERTAQVRALAVELTLAEQRERQRIALVLHDDIQQMLTALQIELHLTALEAVKPEIQERLLRMTGYTTEITAATRSLAMELSPPAIYSENLENAFAWLGGLMNERYQLEVKLEVAEGCQIADRSRRELALQLVRELLFNVVKHAGVRQARLIAHSGDEQVIIQVVDDGHGFDTTAAGSEGIYTCLGLNSISHRLDLFGGSFKIDSTPGQGTRATIHFPVA